MYERTVAVCASMDGWDLSEYATVNKVMIFQTVMLGLGLSFGLRPENVGLGLGLEGCGFGLGLGLGLEALALTAS